MIIFCAPITSISQLTSCHGSEAPTPSHVDLVAAEGGEQEVTALVFGVVAEIADLEDSISVFLPAQLISKQDT
jgi:hypothetical protein